MPSTLTICGLLALLLAALPTLAQVEDDKPAPTAAAPVAWDGVLGLSAVYRPRYPGAPTQALRATPAFYLRYGRYTVSNASAFAPRLTEDVVRGLGVDMLRGEHLGASLSLRYDSGRSERSSDAYAGLGNIPHTVRARLAASWDLKGPWRVGAAWSADVLGRGTGGVGDFRVGWDAWMNGASLLTLSSGLSVGDARYMQAYYGITPAQAARSAYPAYTAPAGWRDVGVAAELRHDFSAEWVGVVNAGATRLLGSAAGSPITRDRNGWSLGSGLGWRF